MRYRPPRPALTIAERVMLALAVFTLVIVAARQSQVDPPPWPVAVFLAVVAANVALVLTGFPRRR